MDNICVNEDWKVSRLCNSEDGGSPAGGAREARVHVEGAEPGREEICPLEQRALGLRNSIRKRVGVKYGL